MDKSLLNFCSYVFSLLLKCLDLESISIYFKLICSVFLSKQKTSIVTESFNSLQDAINTRPIDKNEIKKMVSQHFKEATIHQQVCEENNITNNENSRRNSMINKSKNKFTIADSSPFTKHFKDIEKTF